MKINTLIGFAFAIIACLPLAASAQTDNAKKTPPAAGQSNAGNGPNKGVSGKKGEKVSGQDKTKSAKVTTDAKAPVKKKRNPNAGVWKPLPMPSAKPTASHAKPATKPAASKPAATKVDHAKVATKTTKTESKDTTTAANKPVQKGTAARNAAQHNVTPHKRPTAKKDSSFHDGNGPNAGTTH